MSEAGFRLFGRVFPVGAQLLHALWFTAFFRPFLAGRGRKQLFIFFTCFLLGLLCSRAAIPQGSFGLVMAAVLLAASGRLGLEKAFAILLALLYFSARVLSGLMAESLFFILDRLLPLCAEVPEALYLRAAALVTLFFFFHAALFAAMLYILRQRLQKQRISLCRRELCCLGLMPAAGILFGQVFSRLLFDFKDGVFFRLYERRPALLAMIPLLSLLFYAGAYLGIALGQGMAALREEQAACFVERRQAQALQARIREAEQLYGRVRRLKHDMRGHLTNIRGLARSGEYAGLEEYIARVDESIRSLEQVPETGNPVMDVIVGDLRQRSLELGIDFQADFYYPQQGAWDAFDLGIILQNLLQNAVEACEQLAAGQRFIRLTGKRCGRFFLIEVKNPFAGEVRFGQNGLPATTKKGDAFMHGIGLGSVRREAEKYGGELELKTDGQEFCATVLLQEGIIYEQHDSAGR